MKILISCSKDKYGSGMSFARGFRKLSIEVGLFFDDEVYEESFRVFKNKYTHRLFWRLFALPLQTEFLKFAVKEKPDLILVLKGWYFQPKTLITIKEELPQTRLLCFNPDNPFNTWSFGISNDWLRKSIPLYDVYFIWGKFLIKRIKKAGAKRVEYLPFGYDSEFHYPVEVSGKDKEIYGSGVAFIGSWDKEREWWLNHLLDYDLKIWGNAWEKAGKDLQKKWQKKEVVGEEFSKVCNASKIVLNIIRKQNIPSHNMRTFEVPACGGFLLSVRTEEAKNFFEEDKEAAYFSSPAELREKINFYLKNNDLRQKIAEAGYKKALNSDYSYTNRARRILGVYKSFQK